MTLARDQPRISRKRLRRGIQLLEMLVTLTTSAILVAGIATSIFLGSESRSTASRVKSDSYETHAGLDRLRNDLAEAKSFISFSSSNIRITVPDRNDDGSDEQIRYAWTGANSPLRYSDTYGKWMNLSGNLKDFSLTIRQTAPQSNETFETFDPPGQYVFQSFSRNSAGDGGFLNSDSGTDLQVGLPVTFRTGDLLIAAVVVEGDQEDSIAASLGWTKIFERDTSVGLSLAAFYTFDTSGALDLEWKSVEKSHAVISHFQAQGSTSQLNAFATMEGNSSSPAAAGSAAAVANSLVVRILGTDQTSVPEDATNVPGHVPVTFRSRILSGPAIGVAFRNYASAGSIPSTTFGLTSSRDFASATLVFSP